MKKMDWFRLWNETLNDPKFKRIVRQTGQSKAVLIGVWVTLLLIASESPQRGRLLMSDNIPIDLDDILDETGLNADNCQVILNSFVDMGMVTINDGIYEIVHWDKRQFASDNSTERSRRSREKKRKAQQVQRCSNDSATLQSVASVALESESESESESNINEAELDKKWGSIFSLYSDNINASESPLTIEEMMSEDYLGLPFDWWQQAIKIAGDRNVRKWSYVRGILNKSIEKGVSPNVISEEMKNGNKRQDKRNTTIDSGLLGSFGGGASDRDAVSPVDW